MPASIRKTKSERLFVRGAQVRNGTLTAQGLSCLAAISAMQQKPVVCVFQELGRSDLRELFRDFVGRVPGSEPGSVCHSENVRVNGDRGFAESDIENDLGGF